MDRGGLVLLLLAVVDVVLAAGVTVHAVLWKRDPRAAIAWVGLAWLAPLIGSAAYITLGINRIERLAKSLRPKTRGQIGAPTSSDPSEPLIGCAREMSSLVRAVGSVTGRELTTGNSVRPLLDVLSERPPVWRQQWITMLAGFAAWKSDRARFTMNGPEARDA